MNGKTAVVFSAGMMFGAYQAGVWSALAKKLRPDIVIGASSGSLNAWAVAGDCEPGDLREMWLDDDLARVTRLRLPLPPWSGIFDSQRLDDLARRVHESFRPRREIGIVATEVRTLRRHLFYGESITWRHLAASCSVPFGFRPVRIEERLFVDGGLLGALPVWAASEMGASRVVAVLSMPKLPFPPGRALLKLVRLVTPRPPRARSDMRVDVIAPSEIMGSIRAMTHWRKENIERWIELGVKDGTEALPRLL